MPDQTTIVKNKIRNFNTTVREKQYRFDTTPEPFDARRHKNVNNKVIKQNVHSSGIEREQFEKASELRNMKYYKEDIRAENENNVRGNNTNGHRKYK